MSKDFSKLALSAHKKLKGKISIELKDNLNSKDQLSIYYTPGVAAVSNHVKTGIEVARDYTWLNNSVAVISDGSAVLGLGDIGPYGALPVMEGKCMLFKHFAGIDAVPIVLDVHSVDEIIATVKSIAPSFGGVNLEDIAAPICFEVEETLKKELSIPVFHDDQHGTAIVVLAGLINAMKIVKKDLSKCKVVCVGAGAAGTAVMKLLYHYAKPNIIIADSKGIISKNRTDLNNEKKKLLSFTNKNNQTGALSDAMKNADIFIGVSGPGVVTPQMIESMNHDPIIFAMANPVPEIMPDVAKKAGATIVATGRSDFPNQVNNALAFPGIFRGALDNHVKQITEEHKVAAAKVIADLVKSPTANEIIPSVLNDRLVPDIAKVIV